MMKRDKLDREIPKFIRHLLTNRNSLFKDYNYDLKTLEVEVTRRWLLNNHWVLPTE